MSLMGDNIQLSQKELQRSRVLGRVCDGGMSLKQAALAMGVSYRQAKRLKARFLLGGPARIAHQARGKIVPNKTDPSIVQKVRELAQDKYRDFNDTHFTQMLRQNEAIDLSRETVRKIRRAAGIKPKNKRRPKRHHQRRPPKENFGAMIQWDGSHHQWFGNDKPQACLMAAVDDATNHVLSLHFEPTETSIGYMRTLKNIVTKAGIPVAIYHDKHGALHRNDNHWTIDEQIRGKQDPTQVGMALQELGITSIPANTPQAKGRIEREFKTLQDRLVAEMKLHNITTPEAANPWIENYFLPRYNAQFARTPAQPKSLFRKPTGLDLDAIIAFRYLATVANDNTVKINNTIIQIPPGKAGRGFAKAKVQVRQLLDGSWRVYYKEQIIATKEKTTVRPPEIKRRKQPQTVKAAANVEWTGETENLTP
jgi:transposase